MQRKIKSAIGENLGNKRKVDILADKIVPWWKTNVVYLSKKDVATWKGATVLMFIAGLVVSIVWNVNVWSVKTDYKYNVTSSAAPSSSIYFSPASMETTVGSDFTLTAVISPGTNAVNAVVLRVTFDQTRLRLNSITPSSVFPLVLYDANINNANGTGAIDVAVNLTSPAITTASNVAAFNFRALAAGANSPVNFTTETIAAADGEPDNVIVSRIGAIVTIKTADITPPSGGSISYANGYLTSVSVPLAVADGTDVDSGINTNSRIVQRRSSTLTSGSCGAYGSWTNITPTGAYPNFTDNTVVSGNCYQYQYLVSDSAPIPNQAVYTSASVVRIDTGAPTGGFVGYTDGYYTSATVSITTSDGTDGISGLNTGSRSVRRRTATLASGSCGTYGSWANITPTGTYPNLTDNTVFSGNCYQYQYLVSDNAGNQATYSSSNTVRVDTSPPSGGSVTYVDNYVTTGSLVLTVNDGGDSISGINASSRIVQRRVASFSTNTCGTYGSWANITPTGTYPNFTDNTIASGNCYQYQYRVSDSAGNQSTYTSANIAKVDTSAPSGGSVVYANGFNSTGRVNLAVSDGSDSASGINTASRATQRRSATMTSGSCGSYGSWTNITTLTGAYPNLVDQTVAIGNCYQYQHLVSDNAGLQAVYASTNVVKITHASDVSLNGVVDIFDYNILKQNYAVTGCGNIADMNNDCVVNIYDYNLLRTEYGRRV